MPRHDLYHDIVKNALTKDGWIITHDPLMLGDTELRVYADLCATKTSSSNQTQTLAIEIKVFGTYSNITELERAIGQYVLYRSILKHSHSLMKTYLAIPSEIYHTFFQKQIIQNLICDENIYLLIFNPHTATIEQWNP